MAKLAMNQTIIVCFYAAIILLTYSPYIAVHYIVIIATNELFEYTHNKPS